MNVVESSWNVMAHVDAREGKWRGNCRMEWVASTLPTTSEHGVSSINIADAHTSAASSRLNWRPCRFKWTRPFRRKTKSGFCECAITFQLVSNTGINRVKSRLNGIRGRKVNANTLEHLVSSAGLPLSYWEQRCFCWYSASTSSWQTALCVGVNVVTFYENVIWKQRAPTQYRISTSEKICNKRVKKITLREPLQIIWHAWNNLGRNSSDGLANRYGLHCLGIESHWRWYFPHPSTQRRFVFDRGLPTFRGDLYLQTNLANKSN